jgi:hypothetical protein
MLNNILEIFININQAKIKLNNYYFLSLLKILDFLIAN